MSVSEQISQPRANIGQVGIRKNKEQTGIEEESDEDTVGDLSHLLRHSIVTNPSDQTDDHHTQDHIDSNDDDHDDI